jgi:lipopolysaccharide export system protein LptC
MTDLVRDRMAPIDGRKMPKGRARSHSRLVHILRLVLPIIMVGVIGVLVGLIGEHAVKRQAAAHQDAATPIRMVNPHFYGRDNQGRAYTLAAAQAARDEASFQMVLLTYPTLVLDVDGPKPSHLSADSGIYHEDTRMLLLRGHIKGDDPRVVNFNTNEVLVNTRTGDVVGSGPVAGSTPTGQVASKSFDVKNKGDVLIFKGGVHGRLNQH